MKALDLDSKTLLQETDEVIGDAILLIDTYWRDRDDQQVAHLAEIIMVMIDLRRRLANDLRRQRSKQGRSRR